MTQERTKIASDPLAEFEDPWRLHRRVDPNNRGDAGRRSAFWLVPFAAIVAAGSLVALIAVGPF